MFIATRVESFLRRHAVSYDLLTHTHCESLEQAASLLQVPARMIARSVLISNGSKLRLLVLPLDHMIDFDIVEQILGSGYKPVPVHKAVAYFSDCRDDSIPPFGEVYGIETLYDERLLEPATLLFEAGHRDGLVCVKNGVFRKLIANCLRARFSCALDRLQHQVSRWQDEAITSSLQQTKLQAFTPALLEKRLQNTYELPLMPDIALRILQLRQNERADAEDLAQLIEQDPSLAAQVLRYARSPLFSYRGAVDNVHQAISRVLGFDMVMSLALGLAALKPFNIPAHGPLGLQALWKQSTYTATLVQRLVREMALQRRPKPGLAYLCGLLHNFGYLLMGHLFAPEYYLLNKLVSANPDHAITDLEQQVLGLGQAQEAMSHGHCEMGAFLLRHWDLPQEIIACARYHHTPEDAGEHQVYVDLVALAGYCLKAHGIGDADAHAPHKARFARLSIKPERAEYLTAQLVQELAGVDQLMAAEVA